MRVFLGMNLVLEKITETFDEPQLHQSVSITTYMHQKRALTDAATVVLRVGA
jgi:hypothetical protein